ncbi:MAG: hypothetical protein ACLR4X_03910 [Clostridia bacterium]
MLTGQNGILNRASEAKEKTEIASIDEQRKLAQAEALMSTGKTTYKGVTLPEGFAPTKIDGEDSIDEGLVIIDGYGNEYVWVEVPKTTEVYPTAGLGITNFTDDEYTKIEDDLHTYTRVYRNGTNYRDIWYDAKDDQKEANKSDWYQSESEYNTAKQKMLKSVYQNGGFWVGRYEAGIEKNRTSSGTATTTPLSKQNLYPYNYVTRTQAKKLAEQVEAGSYTSSLMFGVQWDLALKFIEEKTVAISKESNKENVRTKIVADLKEDSKNIGNFKNNLCNITNVNAKFSKDDGINFSMCPYSKKSSEAILLTTGADKSFSLINIYDMAGNVWEWTFEKNDNESSPCTCRGGRFNGGGSEYPANGRGIDDTSVKKRRSRFSYLNLLIKKNRIRNVSKFQ